MTGGRHLITTDGTYSLYVIKDVEFGSYYLNVCRGAWDSPTPDVIANVTIFGVMPDKTPEETVRVRVEELNQKLREAMGGTVPTTWQERMEAELMKLLLFREGAVVQIR